MMTYQEFFVHAFGKQADSALAPFDYQAALAEHPWPDILDIPTGMGKTAAVTLSWLWKRGWRVGQRETAPDTSTPRRLIYCLPMRVLVEQTRDALSGWLQNLGLLAKAGQDMVSVHVLMGGVDDADSWAEHPEEDMILIGTQDMLLSRALMRGYGVSRYTWPVHFSLVHNDAMWVFDEVQLMGAGLTTSAQLEAFRRNFPLGQPSRSLWLSATLNPEWLATVDMKPYAATLRRQTIGEQDRLQAHERLNAIKSVMHSPVNLDEQSTNKKGAVVYLRTLCDLILAEHDATSQTLVIVNTVDRAQALYRALLDRRSGKRDLLIHARFRAAEREDQARRLRDESEADRIVIATQAIEAGVDISSRVLVTELAPWSSLVQRFGRCNRYGEHNANGGARIFWIDISDHSEAMLPYRSNEIANAREKISALTDAKPGSLPPTEERRAFTAVPRRKDLLDLFNTDPDLSGFDVDISDYIRDSGPPGLQVFWRNFDNDPRLPELQGAPSRAELCPISIRQAKGLQKHGAWYWDTLDGCWRRLDREPRAGMTLMLRAAEGGYDIRLGFDATHVKPVPVLLETRSGEREPSYSEDLRSKVRIPVLLSDHLAHVAMHARSLCKAVGEEQYAVHIVRAGRWHDVGKAHGIFNETMHSCSAAPTGLLAKSPCSARHKRKFFRHELASMLAWFLQKSDEPQADLVAYLILAHHGKVRMSLRAMPTEPRAPNGKRFARGIWEGDTLPDLHFDGEHSKEITLQLGLMEMGESEQGSSWASRTLRLLEGHGPFRLAWLECLVRLADWRASTAEQIIDGAAGYE